MIKEIGVLEPKILDQPILVDVRSEGEYNEATLPGTIDLPLLELYSQI